MLAAADTRSLAFLYHLNSEPWLNADAAEQVTYEVQFKDMTGTGRSFDLPAAEGASAVRDVICRRTSCRQYAEMPLALSDLAGILSGTYGLGREFMFASGLTARARPVPSAGALYPLELYLVLRQVEDLDDGVYHYCIRDHSLEQLRSEVDSAQFERAVLAAPLLENANAVLFITAVLDRTLHKYGPRGYRYILLEAGHAAQNFCLLAAEQGLGTLCVGGFMDSAVNRFLEIDPRTEAAVYCVGLGHPA